MARTTELIWKSNNRSVIRGLEQIASQSEKTSRTIKRDGRENASTFEQMGRSAGRMRGMIGGLAGAVGFGGLAFGIKNAVNAGMAWQQQTAQLSSASKAAGTGVVSQYNKMIDAAERLATHGGFSGGENVHALTQLVTATGSATTAIRDMNLATDIARRTGRDYNQVVKALALAEQGHTTGLTRLGIAIPKVTSAEDALKSARQSGRDQLLALEAAGYKFTAAQKAHYALTHQITPELLAQAKAQDTLSSKQSVFAALQQKFGGATGAFSGTTAGRVSNMRNAWESLQKSIGVGLLPVLNRLIMVSATVVGWLSRNRAVLYALMGAVAAVTGVLTTHAAIVEVVKAKNIVLAATNRLLGTSFGIAAGEERVATIATIAFGDAMKATVIGAIVFALVMMVTHFKTVKRIAVGVFHALSDAAKAVWGAIKAAAEGIYHALTWAFKTAWQVIQRTPLGGLLGAGVNLVQGHIGKAFGSLLHGVTAGLLSTGGVVRPQYFAGGGPVGTDRIPGWLSPGEGVVNTRGMDMLGEGGLSMLNAGGAPGGQFVINPGVTVIKLDSRQIAEAVTRYALNRGARGPTSLIGGSLVTGAPGLPA